MRSIAQERYKPQFYGEASMQPGNMPPNIEFESDEPERDGDLNAEQMNVLLDSLQ